MKKTKQNIKANKIDDDEIEEVQTQNIDCELINNTALIELCYYDHSKLSLIDTILCYHEMINQNISTKCHVEFINLVCDGAKLKSIEERINQIIKN